MKNLILNMMAKSPTIQVSIVKLTHLTTAAIITTVKQSTEKVWAK